MSQASETRKESARAFAQKHSLTADIERDLALLLEKTWQDGVWAERTLTLLEDAGKK